MIPINEIIDGIALTPTITMLIEAEEVKPSPRHKPFYDFLAEIGLLQRRGDRYRRSDRLPPKMSKFSKAIARIFQEIALPYIARESVITRLSPDLLEALYTYIAMLQPLRVMITQEFLDVGGLALVAGWLPCGFSTELMSIAGMDVVIAEEREDLVALEMERFSFIPYAPTPLGSSLAASSFYAFEILSLKDLTQLVNKYGVFDTAIVCNRGVDPQSLSNVATKIYYIIPTNKVLMFLNNVLLSGLGLTRSTEDLLKRLERTKRSEVEGFAIYSLSTSVAR